MIYTTKLLAAEFEDYISNEIRKLNVLPLLHVIQLGGDFASSKYVSIKQAKCTKLGLPILIKKFAEDEEPLLIEQYLKSISKPNSGIIIQLPVAKKYSFLVNQIQKYNDIDLLATSNVHDPKLNILSPTIGAIDLVLKKLSNYKYTNFEDLVSGSIDLTGKTIAIIGQGTLVGKPLVPYFIDRNATIISINKETSNPQEICRYADIVITAAGVENLVDKNWLSENTILIDAATLESDGVQRGDVNKDDLNSDTILCPSPGGIGSLTVLYLIFNLLRFNDIYTV